MAGGTPKILLARARVIGPANSFRFFQVPQICRDPYRGHALQQLAGSKLMLALMGEYANLNLCAALNFVL